MKALWTVQHTGGTITWTTYGIRTSKKPTPTLIHIDRDEENDSNVVENQVSIESACTSA